jgi:hypothetical protein
MTIHDCLFALPVALRRSLLQFGLVLGFAVASIGCASASGNINMDTLEYPASMSPSLYGSDSEILTVGQELTVVEDFEYEQGIWSILYGSVSLSSSRAIAKAMNKSIKEARGDGLVNLSIESDSSVTNYIGWVTWLAILPITPGCANVTVKGQIVRVSR